MRRNDRNAGSIKALIVLTLLIANIVVALPGRIGSPSLPKPVDASRRSSARPHTAVPLDEPAYP